MPCTSAYYEKPKHKNGAPTEMHLLTQDVGIFIVLTVKIVVQVDVATDK